MMIAKIETDSFEKRQRRQAGLLDPEDDRSELELGWAIIKDFSGSNVLERLLIYEKRIESSLYKAMNEPKKLQRMRKTEQAETVEAKLSIPIPINDNRDGDAPHCGRDAPWGQAHETQGRESFAEAASVSAEADALAAEAAIQSEGQTAQMKKQSQSVEAASIPTIPLLGEAATQSEDERLHCAKQSQFAGLRPEIRITQL